MRPKADKKWTSYRYTKELASQVPNINGRHEALSGFYA